MECKRKANYFLVSLAWIRVHVACVCLCRPWSTSSLSSSDVSCYSFYPSFQLSVKRTTSWSLLHAIVKQTTSSSLWHGSVCTSKLVWAFMTSVIVEATATFVSVLPKLKANYFVFLEWKWHAILKQTTSSYRVHVPARLSFLEKSDCLNNIDLHPLLATA